VSTVNAFKICCLSDRIDTSYRSILWRRLGLRLSLILCTSWQYPGGIAMDLDGNPSWLCHCRIGGWLKCWGILWWSKSPEKLEHTTLFFVPLLYYKSIQNPINPINHDPHEPIHKKPLSFRQLRTRTDHYRRSHLVGSRHPDRAWHQKTQALNPSIRKNILKKNRNH
jgi:hypothetical protein